MKSYIQMSFFEVNATRIFTKHVFSQVCSEIINEFRDEFITVALKLILYPDWLCYAALGPSCGEPPDIFPFWNVTIPGNKPKPQPLVRPRHGLPVLKVVQLSDVHVDLEYKPGGVKDCGEPLCCREGLLLTRFDFKPWL